MSKISIQYIDYSMNPDGEDKTFSMESDSFEMVNMAFQDKMDELGLFENKDYIVYHRLKLTEEKCTGIFT